MAEDLAHARLASQALGKLIRAAIDAGRTRDVVDVHEAWLRDLELGDTRTDSATSSHNELREAERRLRIGFGLWTIRAGGRGNDAALPLMRYFASTFDSPRDVLEAVSGARRASLESDEWLDWTTPPRFGGTYSPSVDLELLQSGLAMCVLIVSRGGRSPLPPFDWLPLHLDEALRILREFSDPWWEWLFGATSDLDTAIEDLSHALERAAQQQRDLEADRIREVPLSDSLRNDLDEKLLATWDELALVRRLFARLDRVDTEATEGPPSALHVVRTNLLRSYLIEGSSGESNDLIAAESARPLARMELESLVTSAQGATMIQRSDDALTARLEAALTHVDIGVSGGLAILMPVNPLVEIELGLRQMVGSGPPESIFFGPAGVGNWYRGSIGDTPVIQYRAVPRDRMIVLGAAWGRYIEWIAPGDPPVSIELTDTGGEPPMSGLPQLELKISRHSQISVEDMASAAAFRIDDLELRLS